MTKEELWERKCKLKSEILKVFKENQATVDEVDFTIAWLTHKASIDKKHFLKHMPIQEVFRGEDD